MPFDPSVSRQLPAYPAQTASCRMSRVCKFMRAQFALIAAVGVMCSGSSLATAADGLFVRFQLLQPTAATYYVKLGGYIHKTPWYLPRGVLPTGSDKDASLRTQGGQYTPWLDVREFAGDRLHGRMNRAGGVAEFPNMTADFVVDPPSEKLTLVIELATQPQVNAVQKRWRETIQGTLTSFLVSPSLARDKQELESAAEMTNRRLQWAREATGGKRHSPQSLLVQTSLWAAQRPELNLREAQVLELLGFNVVGNQPAEVRERASLAQPGHTHSVAFGPAATRQAIVELMQKQTDRIAATGDPKRRVPFNFADEVCCRPAIGDNAVALGHFHAWLAQQRIKPTDLGVARLTDVEPIETPEALRQQERKNGPAARRIFYYTSHFRQQAATERVAWHTDAFHQIWRTAHPTADNATAPWTSTLVADHPYFAGSGLGMGMEPNPAWSGHPLAMDWFELARSGAVDLAGIEDWMGLQYMYGPNWTWEGFQLMGFQAAIFRSGSQGRQPTIAWITPSDETNLRLKSSSALCQGAKHFFYWTYGPTATSTENYWSDLRGAYHGVAAMTRQLAAAEKIIAPGRMRPTKVALLYSISSDLWQPFGYVSMLERRGLYLSLVHDQYLVDMLTEEDVEAGRLADYDVLYTADPCIKRRAAQKIAAWVKAGGHLQGTTAAGSRDEFNEPCDLLAVAFGVAPELKVETQPGRYHIRGALNNLPYLDQITGEETPAWGAIGARVAVTPAGGSVVATFNDGSAAIVDNTFVKGSARYLAACPGIAYLKEAKFVPDMLAEKWPNDLRGLINAAAEKKHAAPVVELSHPVVEAGVYDSDAGTALVLANFQYDPIARLHVRLTARQPVKSVRSVEQGAVPFAISRDAAGVATVEFDLALGLNDIVLLE
ncbi:type 1 glutamine amidotransferase family protein [Lignipirellula cremea]|uniref:Beta-galactosidase trimerization domain protein n=1 Tax=Lignipirellula cremea TaxID=2528010 RepID=A0A518DX55_9BACT|nr:hypothetical protein [Lignipirellula cremea]QDU96438.1 Beta-galactosidase trimerization domain protein [Lignipirellula cremea]